MYFIELTIFVLAVIAFFILAVDNVKQRFSVAKLNTEINQSIADYISISQKLEEALKNTDEKKIEETEGFLKFVSDSRDWAFQYIEQVQLSIVKLQEASRKTKIYPNSYILTDDLEDLRHAVAEVLRHLPDDYQGEIKVDNLKNS